MDYANCNYYILFPFLEKKVPDHGSDTLTCPQDAYINTSFSGGCLAIHGQECMLITDKWECTVIGDWLALIKIHMYLQFLWHSWIWCGFLKSTIFLCKSTHRFSNISLMRPTVCPIASAKNRIQDQSRCQSLHPMIGQTHLVLFSEGYVLLFKFWVKNHTSVLWSQKVYLICKMHTGWQVCNKY